MSAATTPVPVHDAVVEVLDTQLRPMLRVHGGGITLVSVSADGDVGLRFEGACTGCALRHVTYAIAVRQRLLNIAGVRSVSVAGVNLSQFALDRVADAYAHTPFWAGPRQQPDAGSEVSS